MEPTETTTPTPPRWALWFTTNIVLAVGQTCLVQLWLHHVYPTRSGGDWLGYYGMLWLTEIISIPATVLAICFLNFWACRATQAQSTGVYALSVMGSTFLAAILMVIGALMLSGATS